MSAPHPRNARPSLPTVGYVMTHYPHPSHSFLLQEIQGVRARGLDVVPISVNVAEEAHLLTATDRDERDRTFYVKGVGRGRAAMAVAATFARHPVRTVRFVTAAAASGGTDVALVVKRLFQAVEGLLVWRHGSRHGITHLHAHFARTPAFVARFAVAAARQIGGETWTWSVTVHGPHDFMNEVAAGLDVVTAEADGVIAISDFACAQLMRLAPPERRTRVAVVRCGIDLDRFPQRTTPPSGERLRLLNVGRLAPEKGQWVLLDALRRVVDAGIDADLRIIGDGPLRAELEQQVADLGLVDRVRFLGNVPQLTVRAELEASDVFCMPSFAEGLPISIMEALAIGVPVVVTSIAGIPELVVDGVTGCCVPAGSVDDFAAAIIRLGRSPEDRIAMVAAGRARVEQRHDARDSAARLVGLLDGFAHRHEEDTRHGR